jgi:hypothetical protein
VIIILNDSFKHQIIEKEIEIESGKKITLNFPFEIPTGILECSASLDSKDIETEVEVYKKESGKLVATYKTPFTIKLKIGEYRLRATH